MDFMWSAIIIWVLASFPISLFVVNLLAANEHYSVEPAFDSYSLRLDQLTIVK